MVDYRKYSDELFTHVFNFLLANNVEPPAEPSELDSNGIVAMDKDTIVGFMWALVGNTSKAYVDFFAVAKDYRNGTVAYRLVEKMDELLKSRGMKKYNFHVEKWNTDGISKLLNYADKYNVKPLADLHYFQREL